MSYNVRFPLEKLNELASTVTNFLTQVSTLTAAVTVLSQHITQLESEPGYTLPPNATFTQLTCSDLYYLDENGNIQDLEQELAGVGKWFSKALGILVGNLVGINCYVPKALGIKPKNSLHFFSHFF